MILLWTLSIACSGSLKEEWDWNDEPLEDTSLSEEGPLKTREINATNREEWVYLDLENNEMIEVEDPEDSLDWDLGLMRYNIKLNSGIHGPADVAAALLEEDFDSLNQAPAGEYLIDFIDEEEVTQYVFQEWYIYNIEDHTLTPNEMIYVIRNRNELYYKFQILDYYNSAGTPAMITIQWEEILPPS